MTTPSEPVHLLPSSGFGGLSLRTGTKPIIAAVSGLCVGGGTEMLLGCDIVVASRRASFTLPDVKVGLTLLGGAAPALVGKIGRGRASEMVFTGRTVSAIEAESWGLVDKLVKDDGRDVVQHAIDMAKMIAANSPHAVEVSRRGLMLGESDMGVREAGRIFIDEEWKGLKDGGDPAEGVRAFVERRPPVWGKGKVMGESNL
jgi:enoyl-CoA hydratase/carnithine racemase